MLELAATVFKLEHEHWCLDNKPQVVKMTALNQNVSQSSAIKWAALGVLVLQNTALVLLMRQTLATLHKEDQVKYVPATAVVNMELVKLVTCMLVIAYNGRMQ